MGVPNSAAGDAERAHPGPNHNSIMERSYISEGKIARYKIPKYVFFIDEFPLTGSGKIQKFKLKEMSLKLCEKLGIEVI